MVVHCESHDGLINKLDKISETVIRTQVIVEDLLKDREEQKARYQKEAENKEARLKEIRDKKVRILIWVAGILISFFTYAFRNRENVRIVLLEWLHRGLN